MLNQFICINKITILFTTYKFNNALKLSTLTSNSHTLGILTGLFLDDDGNGIVRRVQNPGATPTIIDATVGTINYVTGNVSINNLIIDTFTDSTDTRLKIIVAPTNKDVTSLRDQVLTLDVADPNSQAITLVAETP